MITIGNAAELAAITITGQAVAYALSIVLARHLGIEGFEAYAVASAVFTFMVMFTPRGIEKYALRLLPALLDRGDLAQVGAFLRFGFTQIILRSVLVAGAVAGWVYLFSDFSTNIRLAIVVSCLSLPAGALVHYGIEILSAHGRLVPAMLLFRIGVPAVALALVAVLLLTGTKLSGAVAVACWGVGWLVILIAMSTMLRRTLPPETWSTPTAKSSSNWLGEARPFWLYRISLALLAQAAIIALDRLHPSASAVGAYAAAVATANLPLVLVTSTNRLYARQLAIMLEKRNVTGILRLRRERLRWLVPLVIGFLVVMVVFGRPILGTFRPEFIEEGYLALLVLTFATGISMLFALAPTYLKYSSHGSQTLVTVAGAAAVQIVLLFALVPKYAALGAALAFGVSVCGMYLAFARAAYRHLLSLQDLEISGPGD